ncbi:antirestriction protein ArdA [Dyadobacter sp. LHD-138]|uniref:antirestriction protein ArdA n=1 Tax=Dyadobacter sp. LHD-138 TaxID=3071413 RepID=UPI0027DF58A9|nr:antirestriction protein ArdA [Dyadobacter sp. LHD-138]MDQ6479988.1 antirestriction protein ArdA [Dyadobacter sp. LHD-138]
MKISENTPKIYVGTYGMYNSGSLFGKWFDLSDYTDTEEFFKDCYEYHRNEFLPELMFQDWENIPDFLISESNLHEDAFKYFEIVSAMDDDTTEAFEIYCAQIVYWPSNGNDLDETLEGFEQSYQGYFGKGNDPKKDFAYQFVEDTGLLAGAPDILERYFDYEAYGRDLFLEGYSAYEGYVFIDQ